jgi:hypothetical protein
MMTGHAGLYRAFAGGKLDLPTIYGDEADR